MVVTIMDLLNGRGGSLDKATPGIGPPKDELVKEIIRMGKDEHHQYAATLTVDAKYKVGSRLLRNLPPYKQCQHVRQLIPKIFDGMVYMGCVEYTKVGCIHVHFIVGHPLVKVCNSTIITSIGSALRTTGQHTYCKDIGNIEEYAKYITKEYDPNLRDNVIYSHHYSRLFERIKA